ncbi:MAG: hypothetical protein DRP57_11400 [Spirochaetes bacterium]|nr:MAG: hypothetical protein DRP57_11400 [Spirochaetota bacterium]
MDNDVSRVALIPCSSYDRDTVCNAVEQGVELLGGIDRFLIKKEKVLLKPNLLAPDSPERGSTTHPSVFFGIGALLRKKGYKVVYGDSFAVGSGLFVAKRNGIHAAAEELGIENVPFKKVREVKVKNAVQNSVFQIAEEIFKTNNFINIPKLKTHGLTVMTGALKNIFGVIPGLLKPEFHMRLPSPDLFENMLVDLNRAIKSSLIVMDAVDSMEGNGPRNGTLVHTGVIIISDDPAAVDATGALLMGVKPESVPLIRKAGEAGIGNVNEEKIEYLGGSLKDFTVRKFSFPPRTSIKKNAEETSGIALKLRNWFIPKPVIDSEVCTKCGNCVRICPVTPKALSQNKGEVPQYNYNLCIRCYCCQETCPEGAISIKTPLLGKISKLFGG